MAELGRTPGVRLLWAVVALLAAQSLAVSAFAVALVVDVATVVPEARLQAAGLLVIVLAAVAWLVLTVRGLLRHRGWARSSAVFWQLVWGVIGVTALTGGVHGLWIGVPALAVAVAATILLFSTPVVRLTDERGGSGERGDPGNSDVSR